MELKNTASKEATLLEKARSDYDAAICELMVAANRRFDLEAAREKGEPVDNEKYSRAKRAHVSATHKANDVFKLLLNECISMEKALSRERIRAKQSQ